ncbi:MAG: hypothetical protein MRZ90_06275 [Candidatus Gastranaerophilales bacterium]|nr:hypothetical protein [Candidatus Gastranaerophilales bacterium]
MMENEANIILEQYRIYTESKDKFIDRSFQTNRHYFLVLCGLCIVLVLFKQFFPNIAIIFNLLLSFSGMGIAILWYLNQDSYSFLIKIKYARVLEELENKLPIAPNQMEHKILSENLKKRHAFVFIFSDIQKFMAVILFLLFLIYFLLDVIPFINDIIKNYLL